MRVSMRQLVSVVLVLSILSSCVTPRATGATDATDRSRATVEVTVYPATLTRLVVMMPTAMQTSATTDPMNHPALKPTPASPTTYPTPRYGDVVPSAWDANLDGRVDLRDVEIRASDLATLVTYIRINGSCFVATPISSTSSSVVKPCL